MKNIFKILTLSVFSTLGALTASAQDSKMLVINLNKGHHAAIIYPNPAKKGDMVKIKSSAMIKDVEIMNVIGTKVKCEQNKRLIFSDWILDLKGQESGTYLAKITFDDDKVIVKKILVE